MSQGLFLTLIIQIPVLLFSITIHEYFHAFIADKRGDDTARLLGRLTLNPIAHIDIFGTIILPLLAMFTGAPVFGWAKPVPVNPLRLKNPRRDMMFVGLAGPFANFSVAVLSSLLLKMVNFPEGIVIFQQLIVLNVILAVFNLIPVPPLDGSNILTGFLPDRAAYEFQKLTPYGFVILLFLLMSGILWRVLGPIVGLLLGWLGMGRMYV